MVRKEVATSPQPSPSQGEGEDSLVETFPDTVAQTGEGYIKAYSQGEREDSLVETNSDTVAQTGEGYIKAYSQGEGEDSLVETNSDTVAQVGEGYIKVYSQEEGEDSPVEMNFDMGAQVDGDRNIGVSQREVEKLPNEKKSSSEAGKIRKGNPSPRGEGRVRGVEFARALRQRQTPQEKKVWSRLRDRRLNGYKFRRQHPIGPFVADFYCAEARLVIELDGGGHARQREYDQARTDWLQERGFRVIRFTNTEIERDLDAVLDEIVKNCVER